MIITWEDRKSLGKIDNNVLEKKPNFSFEYAWFLVNDNIAQYVESHEPGKWNKDMTETQLQEVLNFYATWAPEAKPEPTINDLYSAKKLAIKSLAQNLFANQVKVDGIMWRGGQGSAQSIFNAVNMAEYSGLTSIDLRDASRKPHTYSLDQAKGIAAAIGADYQIKWQAEEQALLELDAIDLAASDAIAQINAITIQLELGG